MAQDRRKFLKLMSAGAVAAAFPASIKRALAIPPRGRTGTIADVEHVVFLMQENRSFDHYFGTLRGVRGFGDPRAVSLPSGDPVWHQPNGSDTLLPFHPSAPDLGLAFIEDLPHGWTDTHQAWNKGKYDQWVAAKGTTTMAYLTRKDIPFHYALADAFTVCDAYYCSLLGPTDPNRYHMWTGWVGNDGKGGGPVVDNAEAGYDWSSYPERLQAAGVTWKVYQDQGAGLDGPHFWGWGDDPYIGNYGDNSLLYLHQYQNAQPGSPLFQGARTGTNVSASGTLFDDFRKDAVSGKLPQVSWIVAPEAYTEHPNWPANYGAWYVSQVLDALTENPEVWSKTAFFLMYDENDGFFDHMVPPTPPASRSEGLSTVDTTNEIFPGSANYARGPYGLGVRVPMIVISPWSTGGWVNSEVFDHTSLLRFLERRFGGSNPNLIETNITKWRRAITGDLTSAFDFRNPLGALREIAHLRSLPDTDGYQPPDRDKHDDYQPALPTTQSLPRQEPGVRPARAVPYNLEVHGTLDVAGGSIALQFENSGKSAAVFQVRSGNTELGPWTYTVAGGEHLTDSWPFVSGAESAYDLSVYGPNGFMRTFKGGSLSTFDVKSSYRSSGISLEIRNVGRSAQTVAVWDAYTRQRTTHRLQAQQVLTHHWPLLTSFGWYDLTVEVEGDSAFTHQLAGHVETGRDGVSDPALGS